MTGPGTHDGKTPIDLMSRSETFMACGSRLHWASRPSDATLSVDWCTQTPRRFPESIRWCGIQFCQATIASMHGSLPGFEHLCVGKNLQHFSKTFIILKVPSITSCFWVDFGLLIHLDHRLFGTRASFQFLRAKVRATVFRSEGSKLL